MKKGIVFSGLLIGIILLVLFMPLVSAQIYSGFNRGADNVKLFFSNGDNKVKSALEIREKEINSALVNVEGGKNKKAFKNLERALVKLKVVQEEVSLETSEEVKTSVTEINEKINKDNLPEEFKAYGVEETKTQLVAELTLKTFEYCKLLAQENYSAMLIEERCNPDIAQKGLEKELEELKQIQEESFVELMLDIRSCIDDPGTCNCEEVLDAEEKAKCEKLVGLAIKCEYSDDETACGELESMKPLPGDGFAKSFVPDFLINLFSEKHDMIEYNISHSDGVPEECWDKNNKSECEQYEYLKETRLDWDKQGNFIGTNRARGIQEPIPTMQESVPQCYDKENNFLEEKCGKITITRNEEGLVNYVIEKEIENVSERFENSSTTNNIDFNGKEGQTRVNEIKEEINQIDNEISKITYAEGTGPGGEAGVVVEGDKEGVLTGESKGDGGLNPEVKTDVNSGSGGGLNPEVKTYSAGDGTDKNDDLPEPDLNKINPDLYDPDARAPGDTMDDPDGPDGYAEGTTAEGANELAP